MQGHQLVSFFNQRKIIKKNVGGALWASTFSDRGKNRNGRRGALWASAYSGREKIETNVGAPFVRPHIPAEKK